MSAPQIFAPASEAEAATNVRQAWQAQTPLQIEGGATRAGLGRPVQAAATLSTRALTGITLYEPAEMVIAARAGTPLREIEDALASKGQMLPFEPMDHRALYGTTGEPTIGAVAACNISGPRRIQAGAARDSLIGLRLVNGTGEIIKTGGRVVKNVTGLDLVKLNCGAHGTLGLLTEVTFKVLPRPEQSVTLALHGLDDVRAVAALSAALGSPFEVSGAAHLPSGVARGEALTLLRLENFAASLTYRTAALRKALAEFGEADELPQMPQDDIWGAIRDASFFAAPVPDAVWRLSTAPSRAPHVVAQIARNLAIRHFYDWGGGLIWLACPASGDAGATLVRAALDAKGHATLVRGPDALRAAIGVFEPLAAPVLQLTKGIGQSFDPGRVLNPGRMYAGV